MLLVIGLLKVQGGHSQHVSREGVLRERKKVSSHRVRLNPEEVNFSTAKFEVGLELGVESKEDEVQKTILMSLFFLC